MPRPPLKPIVQRLISSSRVGVVVSAGKMDRAVKVRIAGQEWNKKFRKHFPSPQTHLVADPNNSLVEGDVVRISSGWRTSKHIRHVVSSIVAPFGEPVENRAPVLTEEERMDLRIKQRLLKDVRSAQKGRATSLERLAQARRQGYTIPSLEEAMENVRIEEQEGGDGRDEVHKGQVGQIGTKQERRIDRGRETKEERSKKRQAKQAKTQTA